MLRSQMLLLRMMAVALLVVLFSGCATNTREEFTVPASRILETNNLGIVTVTADELANQFGAENVLVVFDLDNTLLAMEQDLGADQWYDWQKALQAADPCNPMVVQDRLAVQGALYFASAMRLTQPDGAAQIAHLHDKGLRVMVLTSRGADFQLQTFRELRRNDLRFYTTAPGPMGGYPETFIPEGGTRPALYQDGVFLTAGQDKGTMLMAILKKTGTPLPKFIVFADDKEHHLQSVLDAFKDSPTSVQAFRYNREDAVVSAFEDEIADQQWQKLEPALRLIEDEFGPDNFDLPDVPVEIDCPPAAL